MVLSCRVIVISLLIVIEFCSLVKEGWCMVFYFLGFVDFVRLDLT
jgi:hypothetical protein